MEKIEKIIKKIDEIDFDFMGKTQIRLDNLTKPRQSLGRLEELAKLVTGITKRENPSLVNKVIFTLAADHGVADEGVSAFPKEVTAQMVYNFLSGGAGINVLANHVGARVVIVDMGVAEEIKNLKSEIKNFKNKKVNFGTKNMAKGPAMTREEAVKSIRSGIEVFESEFQKGIDIIGTGDMGIANTTASSALGAVFCVSRVEDMTGMGTGVDKDTFTRKIEIIKKAIEINKPNPKDPLDVLAKVGGFEIGGLVGIILGAASKRVPVVIDGFISGAAALVAYKLEPKVKNYMIAAHCSVEQGHRIIFEHIGLKPILDLSLRLGEGSGAALGISIVEAGVKILTEMATFKEAKVSQDS